MNLFFVTQKKLKLLIMKGLSTIVQLREIIHTVCFLYLLIMLRLNERNQNESMEARCVFYFIILSRFRFNLKI
jgi:hypothetical protein